MATEVQKAEPIRLHEAVLERENLEKNLASAIAARDAAISMIPHLQDRLSEAASLLNTNQHPATHITLHEDGVSITAKHGELEATSRLRWIEITEAQTNRITEEIGVVRAQVLAGQ